MSNISIFSFNKSPIKLIIQDNTPFFNLIDVCDVFGIQNPRRVLSLMLDSKGVRYAYALAKDNKSRRLAFISEPNLYRIIFRSDKSIAVLFQNWVFDEVLPTIRKTGSYSLTINAEQQQKIKQAVNERVYRTGEKHQAIYSKFHQQFKIPRYQDLPASNFDEAIKWLGGVHVKLSQFTNDELCTLAWCYKAAERMRQHIRLVTEAMYQIKSEYAPAFYSMGIEYKSTLENARIILDRETKHIDHRQRGYLSNNWNRVLPCIRHHNLIEAA